MKRLIFPLFLAAACAAQPLSAHESHGQAVHGGIVAEGGAAAGDRDAQIALLNSRLRDYCDQVAQAFPGVGVGYFHLGLSAMITYGPSAQYAKTVGLSIPPDHPGWRRVRRILR